jgi:GxxExxY protein
MPIEGVMLPRLGRLEMRALDYEVMRYAFASHRELGRMCDESIYQADLAQRLVAGGIDVEREVGVRVWHGDFEKRYLLDLLVAGKFIYELKTVSQLTGQHEAQLLNYLLLTNTAHGKLINFRPSKVETRFVNAPVDCASRRNIRLVRDNLRGDAATILRTTVLSLAEDWGLYLDLALYTEALTFLLGGDDEVIHGVPMSRDGVSLGNQRMRLCADGIAFRVTGFKNDLSSQEDHLLRLLDLTPLRAIHWIDFCRNQINLTTVC